MRLPCLLLNNRVRVVDNSSPTTLESLFHHFTSYSHSRHLPSIFTPTAITWENRSIVLSFFRSISLAEVERDISLREYDFAIFSIFSIFSMLFPRSFLPFLLMTLFWCGLTTFEHRTEYIEICSFFSLSKISSTRSNPTGNDGRSRSSRARGQRCKSYYRWTESQRQSCISWGQT